MKNETLQLLDKHFDTAFAAPDGITKLRELILTLAMQGKLVPQNPNDPPASELLKEIEAEKQRLVNEGKIKKPKALPEIKPGEVPYELPLGWEWVTLGTIAVFENGDRSKRYPKEQDLQISGVPFFGAKDMVDGVLRFDNGLRFISKDKFNGLSNGKLTNNDFVILLRGTVGKIGRFQENSEFKTGFINAQMLIIRLVNQQICNFFSIYSVSHFFQSLIASKTTGSAVRQMPAYVLAEFLLPIPPLPEQNRIVAKVDQLMARCEELEKLRAERKQLRLSVHTAAIQQLLDSEVQDDHTRAWQFLTRHFDDLYTVKENVSELRKVILQLAVMGKLVPQDPNDPPTSELLKQINAEKQRLVKKGKIKEPKPLPEIKPEEVPFNLPYGWKWVRLGDLSPEYQNGISKRGSNDGRETIVLRLADIVGNEIALEDTRSIRLTEKELENYLLDDGDILITRVNGSIDLVGSFIRVRQFQSPLAYCDHFIRMRLPLNFVDVDYLHTISKGALIRRQIEGKFVTTAGQKTVNQTHVTTLVLPIPPLAEQHRIVGKINQLMAQCDKLEQQIDAATCKQTELLKTVLAYV